MIAQEAEESNFR
uniref:Uncharacterized protein n=1 Tax=Anguilla anguilla TaxID=7936 RepID=A0A0E9XEP5_ANGAN